MFKGKSPYHSALGNRKHKSIDIAIIVGPNAEKKEDETDELAPEVKPDEQSASNGMEKPNDQASLAKQLLESDGEDLETAKPNVSGLHNRAKEKMKSFLKK